MLSSFKNMLERTAGEYFTDEAPSDELDEDEAAMQLTQDKTFRFLVPGHPNHFRIKNEYNQYYDLPTAALNVAIQNRHEINSDLEGNGGGEGKIYWSDERFVMRVSNHENQSRGTDVRTIKFIQKQGCVLLVAYTAETFANLLDSYEENIQNQNN